METHGLEEFSNLVLTLPPSVVVCEGIPGSKWNFKAVSLRNIEGVNVANALCQNVGPDLVVDSDGKPLGDDRFAVQIAESLCEEEVPVGWMWLVLLWHIKQVFFDGVSLYDHDQIHIFNECS